MADDADFAADLEAETMARALAAHNPEAGRRAPQGHCLNPNCLDDFSPDDKRLYCGRECADEAARLERR